MKSLFKYYKESDIDERCGFVLGRKTVEVDNQHPDKTNGFQIDPKDTLRYIDDITGIWHTHPGSAAVLSGEDKLCMEQWPDVAHYIIGSDGVRKYVVKDGVVVNANYVPR